MIFLLPLIVAKKNLLIITIFLLVTGKVNQNDMTKGRCCGMRTAISFLLKNFCRLRLVILENIDYVLHQERQQRQHLRNQGCRDGSSCARLSMS